MPHPQFFISSGLTASIVGRFAPFAWAVDDQMMTSDTMRAVGVIPQKKQVGLLSHDAPRITSPHQVKVRTLEVGICGTDREICNFDYGTPPTGSDYLVLGHEALGEVIEVGSGISSLRPGDLV